MAAIAGITTKKNTKGQVTHVTIDVKKHQDKIQALTEIGVLQKTPFQIECEAGHSIEYAKQHTLNMLRNLPWKK